MMDHDYINASSNVHTTKCTYSSSWFCSSLYARTDAITGSCNSQNKVITNPHFCIFCISLQWEGDSGKERPRYKCSKSSTYIAGLRGHGDLPPYANSRPPFSNSRPHTLHIHMVALQSERSAVRWLFYCQQHTQALWLKYQYWTCHCTVVYMNWKWSGYALPYYFKLIS